MLRNLIAFVVLFAGAAQHAPAAGQVRTLGDPTRDVLQTVQARKRLADDPELAAHNIGVFVFGRVATLWGPVESPEIAFRAELCLRGMVELAEIRNELYVSDIEEPIRPRRRIDSTSSRLPERTLPLLTERPRGILFGTQGLLKDENPAPKGPIELKMLPSIVPPVLGPPQAAEDRIDADQQLLAAVRTVLQSKDAFRPVLFAVKDGRVFLKCNEADPELLREAGRAVARLPNVADVILVEKTPPR